MLKRIQITCLKEFSNSFTVQLRKVLLLSTLMLMTLLLGACADVGNGGVTPDYSPSFDLGATFTIASLGDGKNFIQDEDNTSKYSIEDVSSVDKNNEAIVDELKTKIKTTLETNITGTAVTFDDVGITGDAVADETLTVTVATTITETATANTATNSYIFTIGFAKELVKWDGTVIEITPTTDGVYEIYNGSHLAWIAQQTRLAGTPDNFTTKTVRFMNSVDMDNKTDDTGATVFTGMGEFAGRLEGNHKMIYGLNIDKSAENNVGLISILGYGGYIDNLTIASGQVKGELFVSAFVGQVADLAVVTIKGVTNHATVEGSNFVGAFVGQTKHRATVTIIGVTNHATVKGDRNTVGGLVGESAGDSLTISNSSNRGNITGKALVGGLVGESVKGDSFSSILTIDNSSNTGSVSGVESVGGLVGKSTKGTLTIANSSNTGNVSGRGVVGGLVGESNSFGYTLTIDNSSNIGTVTGTATGTATGANNKVGGLVGSSGDSSTLTISNSSNSKDVTGANNEVGGLVGSTGNYSDITITIDNSSNTGSVSGVESVGGLVGSSGDSSTLTISSSSNSKDVTGKGYVGGLVGYSGLGVGDSYKGSTTLTISKSSNTGTVNGTGDNIGGLVGYSKGTGSILTISKSSNIGTVTGTGNKIGGLVGESDTGSTLTIDNSSNSKDVTGTGNTTGNKIGGLVGASAGKLTTSNSSNSGNIKGHTDIGGLYGYITLHTDEDRTVNSSNSGNVNGENSVGGIIGGSYSEQYLANVYSYAKSITSATSQRGGIVGRHERGPTFTVQSVYWLYDTTNGTVGIEAYVGGGNIIVVTGSKFVKRNITEFKSKDSFIDWDFEDVWEILEDVEYPTLRK